MMTYHYLLNIPSNLHIVTSIIIFKHKAAPNILELTVSHRTKPNLPCMPCIFLHSVDQTYTCSASCFIPKASYTLSKVQHFCM